MEPLKSPLMSPEDKELMRKGVTDHGKCVRQRTVRQETTKYKAGTLPLNMYQTSDTLQSVGERIVWPSEHGGDQNVNMQEIKSPQKVIWIRHLSMTRSPMKNQRRLKMLAPRNRGNKRELNFLFMAPKARSGRIIRTSFRAVLWQ